MNAEATEVRALAGAGFTAAGEARASALRGFLVQYGRGCMAYSTLQPGLEYFIHAQLGYLAYLPLQHPIFAPRRLHVVIGDPIAPVSAYEALLDAYLDSPGAAATAFLEIGADFARLLSRRGYHVNEMGVEWEIDLDKFDLNLRGNHYSHLRRWRNTAQKAGVEVVEGRMSQLNHGELTQLNRDWLKRKGGHEFVGLNRPLMLDDDKDARYFWAVQEGRLLSLAIFDPMYRDGRIIGYLHNLSRIISGAPHGTNDLILLAAIKAFQVEGLEFLSLGLSPLALVADEKYPHAHFLTRLFRFMFRHCQFIYPFEGNFFHKEKYRGRNFKVYVASIPGINLYRVLGVFKALQIF